MRNCLKLIFVYFLIGAATLSAQISSPSANATIGAEYSKDTLYIPDTVRLAIGDTLVFINDSLYVNDTVLHFFADTIYTKDTAYFSRKKFYKEINKQYSYILIATDSLYFFKDLNPFYTDFIFVYNTVQKSSDTLKGELSAKHPQFTDSLGFYWYKYDTATKDFNELVATDTAVTESTVDSLASGGYKVTIKRNGTDTSFVAWVHNNNPYVSLAKYRSNDSLKIKTNFISCTKIDLYHEAAQDTFYYYNIRNTHARTILPNALKFEWKANPEMLVPTPYNNLSRITNPPPKDTHYYITLTDNFGAKRFDTIYYKTIVTKAKFTMKVQDAKMKRDELPYEDISPAKAYSAPVQIIFIDSAMNAHRYDWQHKDGTFTEGLTLTAEAPGEEFAYSYIYYRPGSYTPVLKTYSKESCEHEYTSPIVVTVDASATEAPNFFTPNEDGNNDIFHIRNISINNLSIFIYNSWGKVVHEYSGDINLWKGWDGKVKDTDNNAPQGVYYYMIKAIDWDRPEKTYEGKDFTGKLYLFRE